MFLNTSHSHHQSLQPHKLDRSIVGLQLPPSLSRSTRRAATVEVSKKSACCVPALRMESQVLQSRGLVSWASLNPLCGGHARLPSSARAVPAALQRLHSSRCSSLVRLRISGLALPCRRAVLSSLPCTVVVLCGGSPRAGQQQKILSCTSPVRR